MSVWSKELKFFKKCHGMILCDCPIKVSETNLSKLYNKTVPDVWFGAARALFLGMNQLWHSLQNGYIRSVGLLHWRKALRGKNLSQGLTEDDCVVLSTYNSSGRSKIIWTLCWRRISKGFKKVTAYHIMIEKNFSNLTPLPRKQLFWQEKIKSKKVTRQQ